ncbi:MAG: Gfo/Idh/MocA family oxidoreductase [Caldilineaceae bacterium]
MTQKVKIGVVGCGVVATAYYLPYLMRMKDAEITAVCDRVAGRAADCVRLFGAKAAYEDYEAMLAQADLDAVFILTAPGTHVPFTLAAVQAGKHVLLQKPMATTLADARAIAQAVRTAGVKALIEPSSNSPLDPDVAHLRDLVRQGVLGDILWFTLGATGPTSYDQRWATTPMARLRFMRQTAAVFSLTCPTHQPTWSRCWGRVKV